jgi:hypothetical protein
MLPPSDRVGTGKKRSQFVDDTSRYLGSTNRPVCCRHLWSVAVKNRRADGRPREMTHRAEQKSDFDRSVPLFSGQTDETLYRRRQPGQVSVCTSWPSAAAVSGQQRHQMISRTKLIKERTYIFQILQPPASFNNKMLACR